MTEKRFGLGERGQKFAREVGSVVLGVLIALGLGAVAGEIGWQIEVRNARNAIESELGELIGQGDERVHMAPCVERRLDEIAAIVDSADRSGRLPPTGPTGMPAWRSWPAGVWQSTISAQTASHFDRELLDNYSTAYDFARIMAEQNMREVDLWTEISTIVGPGRPFSSADAATLRSSISGARMAHRMISLAGIRMHQVADAYDLHYDAGTVAEYAERDVSEDIVCQPISAVIPAHYGQAPFEGVIERARANPITNSSNGTPQSSSSR